MRLLTRCAVAAAMLCQLLAAQQPTPAPAEPKELSEKEKEVLDAYLRTITLDADMTTQLYVMPAH